MPLSLHCEIEAQITVYFVLYITIRLKNERGELRRPFRFTRVIPSFLLILKFKKRSFAK